MRKVSPVSSVEDGEFTSTTADKLVFSNAIDDKMFTPCVDIFGGDVV